MNHEFRALAGAPNIISGGCLAACIVEDRTSAQRWITRFASGGMVNYNSIIFSPLLQFWANTLGMPIEAFDYKKAPEYSLGESPADLTCCLPCTSRHVIGTAALSVCF